MKFTKSIPFSIFILLLFATFMAIAGVRAIFRFIPEIDYINKSNTESLYIIDKMFSAEVNADIKEFEINLQREKENLTEPTETEKIAKIETVYKQAFKGDIGAKRILIANLTDLSEINRLAMINSVQNAKKLSIAGTWVIVFMLVIVWTIGIIILVTLKNTIINPLQELQDVIEQHSKGKKLRRCPTVAPTNDFQKLYDGINNLLDK